MVNLSFQQKQTPDQEPLSEHTTVCLKPEDLCEKLEDLAKLYPSAKQALLEQTGHFENLESLLDARTYKTKEKDSSESSELSDDTSVKGS